MRKAAAQSQQNDIHALLHSPSTKAVEGVVKGKTVDRHTGRRLFGVVVELVGTGRAYVTSPSGYFKLEGISDGVHVMRFTFPGFEAVEEAIMIQDGETLDLIVEFDRAE